MMFQDVSRCCDGKTPCFVVGKSSTFTGHLYHSKVLEEVGRNDKSAAENGGTQATKQ